MTPAFATGETVLSRGTAEYAEDDESELNEPPAKFGRLPPWTDPSLMVDAHLVWNRPRVLPLLLDLSTEFCAEFY